MYLVYPDNPTINFVKASILFKTWSYKDSKNILTKIIEISPCAYEAKELAPHLIELINSKTKTKNTFYKIIEKGIIVLGLINVLYAFTSIFAEPYKSEIPKHYYDSIRVIHTGGAIPIVLFILGALISLGLAIVYSRMLNTKVKSEISLIFNLVLGLPCLLLSIYMPFIFLFSLARDFSLEKTSENFALELLIGIIVGPLLLYLFWYLFTFELPWNKKRKKSR